MTLENVARAVLALFVVASAGDAAEPAGSPARPATPTTVVHPQPNLAHATPTYTATVSGHAAAEQRIEALLDAPLPAEGIDVDEISLHDLASLLRESLGIDVTIQGKSLENEGFDPTEPCFSGTFTATTHRQMLWALLDERGLTFRVAAGGVVVTTKAWDVDHPTIVVYPLPTTCVPSEACDLIRSVVSPETWDVVGGPGVVVYVTRVNSLVVSQNQDVHRTLLEFLRDGFDQDLRPRPHEGESGRMPQAVRIHRVADATVRRELVSGLVDMCNAHLGNDADPTATTRTAGEMLIVESSSRPFQVHATEMIRAVVGVEVENPAFVAAPQ